MHFDHRCWGPRFNSVSRTLSQSKYILPTCANRPEFGVRVYIHDTLTELHLASLSGYFVSSKRLVARLLGASWDSVIRVISRVTKVMITYDPH